jgi:hypothetical protein
MFQILILVCSVGVAQADCQPDTALDVINGPTAESEMTCGLHGQAYIAQTSLRPRAADEYVKIKCLHPKANTAMANRHRELSPIN